MAAAAKNEIRISRVYDAPLKAVWEAWTKPEAKAEWWGPRGFTITTHSSDVRTGGTWKYTMHGPDGVDYPNHTKYHEVKKYELLDYDHGGNDDQPPMFRVHVTFVESRNQGRPQTHMEMRMILSSEEVARATKAFIKSAGGNGTWDRLAEHLNEDLNGGEIFVINRTIEAPFKRVREVFAALDQTWLEGSSLQMKIRQGQNPTEDTFFYDVSLGTLVSEAEVKLTPEAENEVRVTVSCRLDESVGPERRPQIAQARADLAAAFGLAFDQLESSFE